MRQSVRLPVIIALISTLLWGQSASFSSKTKPEGPVVKVVCIDPGHGGKDPGCHGDKVNEKDVALAISLKLGAYIKQQYPAIKVVYTRTTDVFVELNERAAIANRNNADIFICIHCNSACVRNKKTKKDVCNEEAHGAQTFVMGLHVVKGNLEVAKRENDAVMYEEDYETKYDLNINSDEAAIIYSTYQNLHLEQSMRFAELCQEQFKSKAGREDRGVTQAGFLVLWKTKMPSVLIETGFLTNPVEERFLGSDRGQTHVAASIFRALRHWKDEVEGNKRVYSDDIERWKYAIDISDTAGLRKPVNYLAGGKPPTQVITKVDTSQTAVIKPAPAPVAKSDTVTTATIHPKPPLFASVDSSKTPVRPPPRDSLLLVKPPADPVVTYRVQIITSDKPLPQGSPQFKGISDIWHYEQKGIYKYTSGEYRSRQEAAARQAELIRLGFTGAFVVMFDKNGNRLTTEQVKNLQ